MKTYQTLKAKEIKLKSGYIENLILDKQLVLAIDQHIGMVIRVFNNTPALQADIHSFTKYAVCTKKNIFKEIYYFPYKALSDDFRILFDTKNTILLSVELNTLLDALVTYQQTSQNLIMHAQVQGLSCLDMQVANKAVEEAIKNFIFNVLNNSGIQHNLTADQLQQLFFLAPQYDARQLPLGQDWLLEAMKKKLGSVYMGGVCHGLSSKWMEIFLRGAGLHAEFILPLMIEFQNRSQDIPTVNYEFFSSVCRYHRDQNFQKTLNSQEKLNTDPKKQAPAITKIGACLLRMTITDSKGTRKQAIVVNNFLSRLGELFDIPFTVQIAHGAHAISIGYYPQERCWIICDANQLNLMDQKFSNCADFALVIANALCKIRSVCEWRIFISTSSTTPEKILYFTNGFAQIKSDLSNIPKQQEDSMGEFLWMAADTGEFTVVENLLEIGALPDTEIAGAAPLFMAAQNGHTKIVDLLLRNKADPNKRAPNGATPLLIAAQHGHTEIVSFLLNKKADLNVTGKDKTALQHAEKKGYTKIVELLKKQIAAELAVLKQKNISLSALCSRQLIFALRPDPSQTDSFTSRVSLAAPHYWL